MSTSNCYPKFSVVFPLYDDRGQALKVIERWTAQRVSEDQFELVIVDAGQANLAAKIRPMLGLGDRIIECPSRNEAVLYNAGARTVRSPWILFTESHVLPTADCAKSLEKALAEDDFDAATLGSDHVVRSRFSDIDARSFHAELSAVREHGLWRCFGLRGMVVRHQVLEAVGWFIEEYYRFCETVFAIQMDHEGYRVVELPDVVLAHVDTNNVVELARSMYFGQSGFCRFWADRSALAAKYFGGSMEEHCGIWNRPQRSRETVVAATQLLKRGNVRAAYQLMKQTVPLLPVALLGWKAHSLNGLALSLGHCLKFYASLLFWNPGTSDQFTKSLVKQYQAMRAGFARLGAIHYYREADLAEIHPPTSTVTNFDASRLSQLSVGFYPAERWHGMQYFWSRPTASLKLPLDAGTYEIRLDIRPTGQLSVRKPQFFIDGKAISKQDIQESEGHLTIRFDCADNPTLAWTCKAFEPRRAGLPDRRKLGFAIIGAEAVRLSSVERFECRAA